MIKAVVTHEPAPPKYLILKLISNWKRFLQIGSLFKVNIIRNCFEDNTKV